MWKPLRNVAQFDNKSLEDVTICWKTIKPPKMYNLLEQSQRY